MELMTLDYEGTAIPCPIEHGHRMVPVKAVCEALQVQFKNQDSWLKEHPYYGQLYLLSGVVAADNKVRKMNCLPMIDLLGWVSSIATRNRSEESIARQYAFMAYFRQKLLQEYQQVTVLEQSLDQERELLNANKAEEEIIQGIEAELKARRKSIKEREKRIEQIRVNRVTGQIEMDLLTAPV